LTNGRDRNSTEYDQASNAADAQLVKKCPNPYVTRIFLILSTRILKLNRILSQFNSIHCLTPYFLELVFTVLFSFLLKNKKYLFCINLTALHSLINHVCLCVWGRGAEERRLISSFLAFEVQFQGNVEEQISEDKHNYLQRLSLHLKSYPKRNTFVS